MIGTTATVQNSVLTVVPKGGTELLYETRLPNESTWSFNLTRTNWGTNTQIYVRDSYFPACDIAVPITSPNPGFNPPTNLVSGPGQIGTQIISTWTDNSTEETGFQIQFSKTNNFATIEQSYSLPANSTSYTSASDIFSYGTSYFVRVRAVKGTDFSAFSNVATANTNAALPTPTNLVVSNLTVSSMNLSWNASAGANIYYVQYGTDPTYTNVTTVSASSTNQVLSNLTANTTYYVRVRASNTVNQISSGYATANGTTLPSTITLNAPTNLVATSSTSSLGFTSTWTDNSSNESLFRVQYSVSSAFSSPYETTVGSNTTTANITANLTENTLYYVRVRAEASNGVSAWSNTAQVTTYTPTIPVPTGLVATSGTLTSLTYIWNYPSGGNSGFILVLATNSAFTQNLKTVVLGPTPLTTEVTGLASGTKYYARIEATRSNGQVSGWSNVAEATTNVPNPFINPVTNLVATPSPGKITLTGKDINTFEHYYRIDTSSTGAWTGPPISGVIYQFRSTPGVDFVYTTPDLGPNKTLTYRVLAWEPGYEFIAGTDGWSNNVTSTTQGTPGVTIPNAPSALTLGVNSPTQITATWTDNSTNEERFRIQRSLSATFTSPTEVVLAQNSTSNVSSGLSAQTQYYFRVRAENSAGNSAWSNIANATTQSATVPAPSLSGYSKNGNAAAALAWTTSGATGITSFTLARRVDDGSWNDTYLTGISSAISNLDNVAQENASSTYYYRLKTITNSGTSDWSNEIIAGPSGGGNGDVQYTYETRASYLSGNYHPVQKFGKFQRPIRDFGPIFDFIGGWNNMTYAVPDNTYTFTNLGMQATGIYSKAGEVGQSAYFDREPLARRYIYVGQAGYEATNPRLSEYLIDNNPVGVGYQFTMDNGQQITVDQGLRTRHWNIVWAWYHRDENNVGINSNFGWARYNAEGHPNPYDAFDHFGPPRYVWQGGTKYAPARAGGTDNTTSDGDPAYAQRDDISWFIYDVWQAQANFNSMHATKWKQAVPGAKVFLYGEGRPGFGQTQNGISGWRKDQVFNINTPYNVTPKQALVAGTYGQIDTRMTLTPFILLRSDQNDGNGHPRTADMSILETAPIHTGTPGSGTADWFSFQATNDNSCPSGHRVTIKFGDINGNLQPTAFPMFARNDYGGMGQEVTIPTGSTSVTYCNSAQLPPEFLNTTIDDNIDGTLVSYWTTYYFNYVAESGKPLAHQIYPWLTANRYQGTPNETQVAGQHPKRFVNAFTALGQYYNVVQVWYQIFAFDGAQYVTVLQALDNLFAANKRIANFNSHFNGTETTLPVEISMDGGTTWTDPTAVYIETSVANDFYAFKSTGYGPIWINNRRAQSQASPLVMCSYNSSRGSFVTTERAVFGNSVSYAFRVKLPNGSYRTFTGRSATRDMKMTEEF